MKRKIALIGPSTLMVSLPSKWAKANSLRKGAEIDVEEREKQLIVSAEPSKPKVKRLNLEAKDIGMPHKNILAYVYHKGYDEVRLNFSGDEAENSLLLKISELIGFEVVSQTDTSCTVRSITDVKSEEYESMLRRTFLLQLEMGESCYRALASGKFQELGGISLHEGTNNKYTDFCKRVLNKYGYANPENTLFMYAIVRDLEKIADVYKAICLYFFRETDYRIDRAVLDAVRETNMMFRLLYELFYKFDPSKAKEFYRIKNEASGKTLHLLGKVKGREIILLHHIMTAQDLIFDLYGPYYAMRL